MYLFKKMKMENVYVYVCIGINEEAKGGDSDEGDNKLVFVCPAKYS